MLLSSNVDVGTSSPAASDFILAQASRKRAPALPSAPPDHDLTSVVVLSGDVWATHDASSGRAPSGHQSALLRCGRATQLTVTIPVSNGPLGEVPVARNPQC